MFFCQAEDGIRDLVRSRGLGDVYKRQDLVWERLKEWEKLLLKPFIWKDKTEDSKIFMIFLKECLPVSYTHLTLPTSDLV
mgnify:CR=1 FL=1